MENTNNSKYAYWEGWLSIIMNFLLFGLKYWAGIVSGSVAIIADAWHTLTDSVSSVIVLVGAKAATKPPDKEHPYGHGRSELVAALLIGVLLALVAFNFVIEAGEKFFKHEEAQYGSVAIWVTVFSILAKEALAQFAFWGARKTGSNSLKADGWHHRSDAISSVVILVGIFVGSYFWWVDSLLALVVAVIIGHAAYKIFDETVSAILGESLPAEKIERIKEICNECVGCDVEAHNILLHNYITRRDLVFDIYLNQELRLVDVNLIVKEIELSVAKEIDARVMVRVDGREAGCFAGKC